MTRGRLRGRRRGWVAAALVAALVGQTLVGRAAATRAGSDDSLGIAVITGMALSAGVVAGLVAAAERVDAWKGPATDWLALAVGPLLVTLGVTGMVAAGGVNPGVAGVCGALGTVIAWSVTSGDAHAVVHSADAENRRVALHRSLEGTTLAAAYLAGSAVGLLGAVLLAGHAAAQTAVGNGHAPSRPLLALGSALFVHGLVLGATILAVGLLGRGPLAVRVGALSFVGGVVVVTGAIETHVHRPIRLRGRADTS